MSGCWLESYTAGGSRNWVLYGLVWDDGAAADPATCVDVYGVDEHYTVNYSAPLGQNWSFTGLTENAGQYPDDPRLHDGGNILCVKQVVDISGQRFLVLSDMYARYLAMYRFSPSTEGEIAIPCVLVNPVDYTDQPESWPANQPQNAGDWIWVDANGNGTMDAGEFQQSSPLSAIDQDGVRDSATTGWWVDSNGDIWETGEGGIREFVCQGLNSYGVPLYNYTNSTTWSIPSFFNDPNDPTSWSAKAPVVRVMYIPSTDQLVLTGWNSSNMNTGGLFKVAGSVMACYNGWIANNGNVSPSWTTTIPYDGSWADSTSGVYLAGNYVFTIAMGDNSSGDHQNHIYNLSTGALVGDMTPQTSVLNGTGWVDEAYALTACLLSNGNYAEFHGDCGVNLTVIELWNPAGLSTCATPTFSPAAGSYSSPQSVTISTTTGGATIRYTTNGTTPSSTAGTVYSSAVNISSSSTLQAIAYKSGYTNSLLASGVYTIGSGSTCATPTFNPAAGTYGSAQSVTISTTTGGASIRYTTNGTTPSSTSGTVYSSPVSISAQCTLQAIAYESGYTNSSVASGVYTIMPTSGMLLWLRADAITGINNGGSVTTWTDQSGNGNNAVYENPNGEVAPTYVTNVYNGMPVVRFGGDNLLQVSSLTLGTYTIAAVFKTTGNSQIVYEHSDGMGSNSNANFLFTSTTSTVSVKRAGTQTGKDIVESNAGSWAANPGVPLLTVDEFGGTDASEVLYINGSQQWLNENYVGNLNTTTAYAEPFNIGEREIYGNLQFNGDIAELVVYNHVLSTADFNTLNTALSSKYALASSPTATLTAPINGTQYNAPASVTLTATASVSGGTISKVEFYNGTTLLGTVTGSPYSYTWTNVSAGNYTLTAIAYSNSTLTTPTASSSITVNAGSCATPTFNPTAGTFTTSTSVTISTTTGGATINYTTNGTTPSSTVGTVYSSPVSISATSTLQAIAYESGYTNSAVASGVYTIQCATPTFNPAAGTYSSTQTVTISTATSGASIRYTTNGTTPSSSVGTVYSSAVSISATCTLQAIAYESGLSNSAVTSGVYTITAVCATPSFNPTAGTFTTSTVVTITTSTGGASIRYTTNGTTPNSSVGTVYSSPVNISASCTLQAIAYETGYTNSAVASGCLHHPVRHPDIQPGGRHLWLRTSQ